jgi:NAD(P)H-flavin reductase
MPNPVKVHARVSDVLPCGPGVYKVTFTSERGFPRFRPGQFLHLTVDNFDPSSGYWPESRVFSIASRSGSGTIVILYSVKGRYTKKMEGYLAPGKEVWLKFPYGDFIIENSVAQGRNVLLIAGGTGVSPFIPFLELNNENGWKINTQVYLAYGLRSPRHLVFEEVYREALKHPYAFGMNVFLENNDLALPFDCGEIIAGMLSVPEILKRLPPDRTWDFFLSGPPAMLAKFREDLLARGIGMNDIKIDEW